MITGIVYFAGALVLGTFDMSMHDTIQSACEAAAKLGQARIVKFEYRKVDPEAREFCCNVAFRTSFYRDECIRNARNEYNGSCSDDLVPKAEMTMLRCVPSPSFKVERP